MQIFGLRFCGAYEIKNVVHKGQVITDYVERRPFELAYMEYLKSQGIGHRFLVNQNLSDVFENTLGKTFFLIDDPLDNRASSFEEQIQEEDRRIMGLFKHSPLSAEDSDAAFSVLMQFYERLKKAYTKDAKPVSLVVDDEQKHHELKELQENS